MLLFFFTLTAFILPLLLTAHLSSKFHAPARTKSYVKETIAPTYTITYPDGTEVTTHE